MYPAFSPQRFSLLLIAVLALFSLNLRADTLLDKFHKSYPARIKSEPGVRREAGGKKLPPRENPDAFTKTKTPLPPDNPDAATALPEAVLKTPVAAPYQPRLSPNEILISPQPRAPASTVEFHTPWGILPFSHKAAYNYNTERGPGFSIRIPEDWVKTKPKKHAVLGGMHYRYLAPSGYPHAPYVVVAVFPMREDVDLADFLAKHQVAMFSSFKFKEARNIILGRRSGIGVYYEGILKMSDVSCHLFLTRYKGKGYAIYGLYFDRAGGEAVGNILNSVRISY